MAEDNGITANTLQFYGAKKCPLEMPGTFVDIKNYSI